MKKLLFLLLFPISVMADNYTNVCNIKLTIDGKEVNVGCICDAVMNYPAKATTMRDGVKNYIDNISPTKYVAIYTDMLTAESAGVVIDATKRQAIVDAYNAAQNPP